MFQFKQFNIRQDRTAMKVGTDGVLLGAWAPVEHDPDCVLDIGAGTGLIALMIAQRCGAQQIDALEVDDEAYEQAVENFEESPWADRLFCYHASLDEFMDEPAEAYDLIVSNPPFHDEDQRSPDSSRDTARFSESMPLEDLAEAAGLLLSDTGLFCVILPFANEQKIISLAAENDLHPMKITRVQGTAESQVKRSLIAFSRSAQNIVCDTLVLETSRHEYTDDYKALTKDFYLKL